MSVKTLHQHIDDFVTLAPDDDYADSSVPHYAHWLFRYADWAGHEATLDDFSAERLLDYKKHLIEHKYADSTRANVHAILRTFGNWLVEKRRLDHNPAVSMGRVKIREKEQRVVPDDQVEEYIDACERIPNARKRALARVVLSLLFYAGLRRSELLALHLSDVVTDPLGIDAVKIIVQKGKGNKRREVPVCDECKEAIEAWLIERPATEMPHLLVQYTKHSLSQSGLYGLLKMVAAIALMPYRNPHSWRHAVLTRMLRDRDNDIKTVADFAGHSKASTTQNIYAHTTDDRKRKAAESLSRRQKADRPSTPPPAPVTTSVPSQKPLRLVGD